MVLKVCRRQTYHASHSLPSVGTMSFSFFKVNKKLKNYFNSRKPIRRKFRTNHSRLSEYSQSIFLEFCEYTNIHGFKCLLQEYQMTKEHPSTASKIGLVVWIASIFSGIFFTVYLFMLVLGRYTIQPTIMTIETNYLETWKVDFPGVTICNVNAIYKPNTLKLTEEL